MEDAVESSDVDGSGAAIGAGNGGRGSAAEDGAGGGAAVHEVVWTFYFPRAILHDAKS